MSRTITIEYTLKPPQCSGEGYELHTSKKHTFEIRADGGQSKLYQSLREGIAQARNEVGQELTAWRDAVGKAELTKETKKPINDDDEEEEDGDGDDA
ncbi:hypothetical protein C8R46DRAFT_210245 [Mycena filopes]|nr:hypothetical protein C8R46DRAFT_210245 [Mycena filopes]